MFFDVLQETNTIKDVDHPCSACAKLIKNRLCDSDPYEVCSQWLKHIRENGVEAESSGSRDPISVGSQMQGNCLLGVIIYYASFIDEGSNECCVR